MLRMLLVHSGDVALPELGERLVRYPVTRAPRRSSTLRHDDWVVKLTPGVDPRKHTGGQPACTDG
jgi:hypothetical protein